MNNRGLVKVSLPALAHILQMDGYHIWMAEVDNNRQVLNIFVSHPSLPETPEGAEVPIIDLYFLEEDDGTIYRQTTEHEEALRKHNWDLFVAISVGILVATVIIAIWATVAS